MTTSSVQPATPDEVRSQAFAHLNAEFDVLVIGGGATGLGVALDAVTRGFRTALVEAEDFAQATSSRSTKLVHGGVRYLASGQIHLVREALHERAVMRRNASHLVSPLPTVLPAMRAWELPWYGAGLLAYDLLSGDSSMGPTRILGRDAVAARVPGIRTDRLSGGVLYHDAQFNDARFALATGRAAIDRGAVVLNYVRCTELTYADAHRTRISGARVRDAESGAFAQVRARTVINAAGIFSDEVRHLDQPERPRLLSVSRGSHVVLPASFLGGSTAVMVPKTEDGRVIFAIPWQGVVLVGTTDIAAEDSTYEPPVEADEVEYLLRHIQPYLSQPVQRGDILSVFSGLRPLVTGKENKTSKLSREHHIDVSASGLVTVAGGKWTTYRRMAQDTLDAAIRAGLLPAKDCVTRDVPLRGNLPEGASPLPDADRYLAEYGTDASAIRALEQSDPALGEPLDRALPYKASMVVYAAQCELARTVEDVLSRRTRALLLDARAALRAAPRVATRLAEALGRDAAWVSDQVEAFSALTRAHYLP